MQLQHKPNCVFTCISHAVGRRAIATSLAVNLCPPFHNPHMEQCAQYDKSSVLLCLCMHSSSRKEKAITPAGAST
jgi:hypothetical protein